MSDQLTHAVDGGAVRGPRTPRRKFRRRTQTQTTQAKQGLGPGRAHLAAALAGLRRRWPVVACLRSRLRRRATCQCPGSKPHCGPCFADDGATMPRRHRGAGGCGKAQGRHSDDARTDRHRGMPVFPTLRSPWATRQCAIGPPGLGAAARRCARCRRAVETEKASCYDVGALESP